MTPDKLPTISLLFSFEQIVSGDSFLARVRMDGRALLEMERVDNDNEAWITGIAPVGIAGGGGDRGFAFVAFRNAWVEVLFDLAAKASSLEDFQSACKAFLGSEQDSMTTLWKDAVDTVRRENYEDPSLHRENADRHPVKFEILDMSGNFGGGRNRVEPSLQVAA